MSCNCPKIYAERDIIGQGEYYPKHVCHMTYEGLHDKSAIAAELAHRDIEIDDTKATITALEAERAGLARYIQHDTDCVRWISSVPDCNCGLDELLSKQEQE